MENVTNQIKIDVVGKIAKITEQNFQLVGGNSDYEVIFNFDEAWGLYNTKTAVFVYGDRTEFKVFEGNVCEGVAISNALACYIGVFTGTLMTTTPAKVDCVLLSITDIGSMPQEPEESVYNQIIELINKYIEQDGDNSQYVKITGNQTIGGKKTFTGRLHTKDIYVGGYFDENGLWVDTADTSSSLRVSGTVELLGEVHADNASFHTHHMDVGGELKVAGDAKFDHDVRMTHSLRVDSKADIREGATIRGSLDMKENDIKNVQSLKILGTLDTYNDIKMKPNTNRADRVKLSDALNEALDYTFKNRIQIDGNDVGENAFTDRFNTALSLIETTSASIIDLKDGGIYEWTQPIVLNKSITFKGSKKEKAKLVFNINGVEDGDECVLFRLASSDITLGFDNVELVIASDITNLDIKMAEPIIIKPSKGLAYTLNADGASYTCSGIGTCTDTEIVIPPIYEGLPVTSIGSSAFAYKSRLTNVVLPNSIVSIELAAFRNSTGLTSIVVPDSVISIGNFAFAACTGLQSIYIPNSVTSPGAASFSDCVNLTIYCEAGSQPSSWAGYNYNPSNRPVLWNATMPAPPNWDGNWGLKLNKCAVDSIFTRYWYVDNCEVSITNSALNSNDKFIGNAVKFWYSNNDGASMPDLTEMSYTETSKLDFFRGDLLVNGSQVLTNADMDDIAQAVLERIPDGDEVQY